MSREIRLDLDVLDSSKLSVNEFLALWKIYLGNKIDFATVGINYNVLEEKKFIKIITDNNTKKLILREPALELIEFLSTGVKKTSNTKKRDAVNVDIMLRIEEYRSLWKGLQLGSMGSLQSCKDKLARWMRENPSYSFDDVLKAASLYLQSLKGDYRFLQRADYFIYKQENNKEESSRLSAFIDEINNGATGDSDWTTKLN